MENQENQENQGSQEVKNEVENVGNREFPQKVDFTFIKDRATSLLFAEKEIWQRIKQEETNPIDLIKYYFCPLWAVPVLVYLFSSMYTETFHSPIASAFWFYILGVFCVYCSAWFLAKSGLAIVNKYSPKVIKTKDKKTGDVTETPLEEINADVRLENSLKTIVYSFTPFYISGISLFIPSLAKLVCPVAAIYSVYNMYLALPVMTNVAEVNRMRLLGVFLAVVFALSAIPAIFIF